MNFTISADVAKKAGVNAALVYNHVAFWTKENAKNKRNYHLGEYWTYNTYAAISAHFGFLTVHQVRRSLEKLVSLDLLKSTSVGFDRTTWYTLADRSEHIKNGVETATIANWQKRQLEVAELPDGGQNCQMQVAELPARSGKIARTTLYTDNNQPITQKGAKPLRPTLEQLIEAFEAKGHNDPQSISETFLDHYKSNGWDAMP